MGKRRRKAERHAAPASQPAAAPTPGRRRILLLISLALTGLVFLPSLLNGFVGLDDPGYLLANPTVKTVTLENVKTMLTQPFVGTYLPITMFSYMVEYHLFGLEPFGYHLTNLVLHLLCTVLVFLITERLVGHTVVAFVTSTLFGIHTLHVESVAWIAARKDVLYAVGFLLALYFYLRHLKSGRSFSGWYWASLLAFVLAALAKAQAVILPIVLILVDLLLKRDVSIKALARKVPFFIPAVALGAIAIVVQRSAGAVSEFNTAPPPYRILLAFYALLNYLWRLVLPINLSCLYPYPVTDGRIDTHWVFLSPLVLLAVGAVAYRVARTSREILFGIAFFAVSIVPFLQIVPLGSSLYADRYTYVSSIGLLLVAGVLAARVIDAGGLRARVMVAVGVLAFGLLGANTFNRTQVWRDSMTLYTDGIEKEPTAALLYFLRAAVYETRGDMQRALSDWNSAVKYAPWFPDSYAHRGDLRLKHMQDLAGAADDYSKVIELRPQIADAYYARGEAYARLGRQAEALADVEKAIAMKPGFASAYAVRGILLFQRDQLDAALHDLSQAIELEPGFALAYFNRSLVHAAKREFDSAYADARTAKQLGFAIDASYVDDLRARASR